MVGIVSKATGKYYDVIVGDTIYRCSLRGKFRNLSIKSTNPIVVGDKVTILSESEKYVITELHPRKNYIVRKSVNLSKEIHILGSNIDQAILIVTLVKPITTSAFIDRFLISANFNSIDVIILFNKFDLLSEQMKLKQDKLQKIYENAGYDCFVLSVLSDDLSSLKKSMKDKLNIISGHSGVGKSTLINKLQKNLNIPTNNISKTHQQGQHTTTFSQLYNLDFGASVVDTPGIKGFGLVDLSPIQISDSFREFYRLRDKCRFKNCIHQNEPDCAVKAALDEGVVSKSRYNNYIKMLFDQSNYRKIDY